MGPASLIFSCCTAFLLKSVSPVCLFHLLISSFYRFSFSIFQASTAGDCTFFGVRISERNSAHSPAGYGRPRAYHPLLFRRLSVYPPPAGHSRQRDVICYSLSASEHTVTVTCPFRPFPLRASLMVREDPSAPSPSTAFPLTSQPVRRYPSAGWAVTVKEVPQ